VRDARKRRACGGFPALADIAPTGCLNFRSMIQTECAPRPPSIGGEASNRSATVLTRQRSHPSSSCRSVVGSVRCQNRVSDPCLRVQASCAGRVTGHGDVFRSRMLAQCALSSPDAGAKPTRPRAQETLDSTATPLTGRRQTRSGERRRIPTSSLSRRRHRRRAPRALTPCPGTRFLFAPGGSARREAPPPDPRPRPWLSDTALPCSLPPRRLRGCRSPCVC
jgi:hypothetical protein